MSLKNVTNTCGTRTRAMTNPQTSEPSYEKATLIQWQSTQGQG